MTTAQSRQDLTSDHTAPGIERPAEHEPRSSYGQIPGEELPAPVYISILLSFAALMAASWLLFDRSDEIGLDLLIGTVLFTAMLGLPILLRRMVSRQTGAHGRRSRAATGHGHVEIYTGRLSSGEAWVQILLIPLTMALAAVAIGLVSLMVS